MSLVCSSFGFVDMAAFINNKKKKWNDLIGNTVVLLLFLWHIHMLLEIMGEFDLIDF